MVSTVNFLSSRRVNILFGAYQLRFHGIKDAKSLWAVIKSRFGGKVESKNMQKTVLKQQFENFFVSDIKGLDKAYDGFQKLISLLEVHGSSGSSSNSPNVAFLSAEDISSSNEVNTANGVSTVSGHNSQGQASSSSYTDDLMFSFFANHSNSPQLDDEDFEQIDHDDLEEMDLKWQVAMLSIRVKRFYKKTGRKLIFNGKEPAGLDKTKVECFNCHRRGHFAREYRAPRNQENRNGDAGYIAQDEPTKFALVSYTSNSPGSDTELGLESVEAQLVVHQKNEAVYEEKIAILEFEVKDKSNAVTRLKNQLDETLREKDGLKAKLEQFETSSKNINKLINSQLNAKDKTGLGYGDQLNENDSSCSELFNSVFNSHSSDEMTIKQMIGLDDFVYRPTTNKTSTSVSQFET
ncbi:putative ribonuclease H-like domain-containing protein, partial [Tanacetum coccineum]